MSNKALKRVWVDQRKPKQLKGRALNPNAAIEDRYHAQLRRLVLQMTMSTKAALERFFQEPAAAEYFAEDASVSSQAEKLMKDFVARFEQIFTLASKPLAASMVNQEAHSSAQALQGSLKQMSGGLTIKTDIINGAVKEVLAASIKENVGLITSIPSEYLGQVQGAVMRSITTGPRPLPQRAGRRQPAPRARHCPRSDPQGVLEPQRRAHG
jgi:uncharacterized protein with gpF-like domain